MLGWINSGLKFPILILHTILLGMGPSEYSIFGDNHIPH